MTLKKQKNFCIAPFSQITFSPQGAYSPCPEIGGRPWRVAGSGKTSPNIVEAWASDDFSKLRENFMSDKKDPICDRCWKNEDMGEQSLRKRLFTNVSYKKGLVSYINDEEYVSGPKQINLMVGNKCNLRCRICCPENSETWNIEGKIYSEQHGKSDYYVPGLKQQEFSKQQIEDIFLLCNNVVRIELYGGEPLIDFPTLDLLRKLIESGQSKDITLFYNTNATNKPTDIQLELWANFKSVELNLSLDDFGDRFNYQRHPAKWNNVLPFIDKLNENEYSVQFDVRIICTVSIFNIYYLVDIFTHFAQFKMPIHLNVVQHPTYYSIYNLPFSLKQTIRNHLIDAGIQDITNQADFLLEILNNTAISVTNPVITGTLTVREPNLSNNEDTTYLKLFKSWTAIKDKHRKQSFSDVFPEINEHINTISM
jgi:MoaA/NifB/PqqE/SkfB family radical SAM enzyme